METVVYRKYIPVILTAGTALIMILEYYLNPAVGLGVPVKTLADAIREMATTITLFAVFLAITVLCRNQLIAAGKAKTTIDKFLAYELLGLVVVTAVFGLAVGVESETFSVFIEHTLTAATISTTVTSTLWSLYGGYRALRLRTLDSAALLIASMVVMAGYAPWGKMYIPGIGGLSTWMLNNINKSVARGITIGGGIGAATAAFRTIIGRERAFIRGE